MARAKLQAKVDLVETKEQFDSDVMGQSYEKFTVIDVFKKWSGQCDVIKPVFDWIFLNLPGADENVAFYAIEQSDIAEWFEGPDIVPKKYGCRPLFAFIKDGELVTIVKGTNAPDITRIVKENLVS